ncbi:multiple sugar transport system permease protein [Microterricola gilva]|uniref:Multiple sugar transport system permease protein n=1 Tax=Microterricola gilva TaxID=393267 RepID=A0A4Q8AQS5_9MICO|nr:carbohydrate ABC transporter permease [Microterricola gilva]RZU67090.1 multiple sugar transport system permease protein [Microterricola gilva]
MTTSTPTAPNTSALTSVNPTHRPRASRSSRQKRAGGITSRTLVWILLLGFAALSVIPMIWLVLAPSKTAVEITTLHPMAFGSFEGYVNAWNNLMTFQDGQILTWLWNSIWYTAMIVAISCVTAILAGYALATAPLPFRRGLLILTLIAMIVPPVALVLPLFLEVTALGLYDSPWSIILTSSFYPFGVFLAYIYFTSSIPKELYEAARIDGCGEFGTFMRVALPLSKGLLGMLAFFSFTAAWVNFFLPYVFVSSGEVMPLPVGLGVLFSSTPALNPAAGANILPIRQPEIALVGLLVAIPILLVFVASAKFLTRGVLAGSVKS